MSFQMGLSFGQKMPNKQPMNTSFRNTTQATSKPTDNYPNTEQIDTRLPHQIMIDLRKEFDGIVGDIHEMPMSENQNEKIEKKEQIIELHKSVENEERNENENINKTVSIYKSLKTMKRNMINHMTMMKTEEKDIIDEDYNEIVYEIMKLEEKKKDKDVAILDKNIAEQQRHFDIKREDLEYQLKEGAVNIEVVKKHFNEEEQNAIEEWSEYYISDVIFDSDVDDWKLNSPVFSNKLHNKQDVLILIETNVNDKFGFYIHEQIKKGVNVQDECSFMFVLKQTGIKNIKKCDKKGMSNFNNNNRYSIHVINTEIQHGNELLFSIGNGEYQINVEEFKNDCFFRRNDFFDYSDIKQNTFGFNFGGNNRNHMNFSVKRIMVFQMI